MNLQLRISVRDDPNKYLVRVSLSATVKCTVRISSRWDFLGNLQRNGLHRRPKGPIKDDRGTNYLASHICKNANITYTV